MTFKIGDRVKVSRNYPADMEHPIAHADEASMWGLIGDVVASEFGYTDSKYIFVLPYGLFNAWPKKEKFDLLPYWHFTSEELERA